MKIRVYLLITVLFLIFKFVWGQEVRGNLHGRILDSQNKPISGVTIIVSGPQLQGVRDGSSDNEGIFRIILLQAGQYTVKLSHVAYQPLRFEDVTIQLGKTTSLGEITMEPGTIEMEEVVITVSKPLIDPTSTTIGSNLDIQTLEMLPVERDYRATAILVPQANASVFGDGINIAGSTGLENVYFIDGVNLTDPLNADGGTILPYNFMREIQVRTGGYEAEYPSALGGVLNAVTRSGGDVFHGQVFGFFSNNNLSGEPRLTALEESVEGFGEYDIGFGMGGPIVKQKLWFYAAYNPTMEFEDITLPGFGNHRDKKTAHLFVGKLSWRVTQNANLVFTAIGDPITHHQVETEFIIASSLANPDPILSRVEEGGVSLALQGDYLAENNLLLHGAVSVVARQDNIEGDTERGRTEPLIIDLETGAWSGGYGGFAEMQSIRSEAQFSATLFLRNHTLKAGLSYEDNFLDQNTQFVSGGLGTVTRVNDSTYTSFSFAITGKVRNRIPGVFLQDSWRLSERLRLNAGLRWDGQYMIGDDGEIAQRITDQFQPRAGVIYQPGKIGTQKLFASYGRFYERIPTRLSSIFHLKNNAFLTLYGHNPLIDPSGGDTLDFSNSILEEVKGLKGQHIDEFVLGYERSIKEHYKIGVRGIYRRIGEVVEDALDPQQGVFVIGNPGRGNLSFLPRLKREHSGLEFTLEKFGSRTLNFMASYVLSQNRGNYTGLFDSDYLARQPNTTPGNDLPEQLENATGLLPNNHTHVFKFSGTYRTPFGLLVGSFFTWQSGAPLNEFGSASVFLYNILLQQRGTAGRTPATWDLNIRLTYDLSRLVKSTLRPKLILDALHIASRREAVNFDQQHFFAVDENGNQIAENPNYLQPISFQPPMMFRLGMQVEF